MKSLLVLMGFLICCAARAQGEKEDVMRPIKQLLEGLQKGDSALLHRAFTHEVTMAFLVPIKMARRSAALNRQ